jgi:hypothetical protein
MIMKIGSLRYIATKLKGISAHNQRTAIVALTLGVGMMCGFAPGATRADQQLPMMTVGYQSGTITAVYETTVQVDGRTYGFTPDVVIVDEEGNPMEPSSVLPNAVVKFHVKKEQSDKIDRMILILPK